MCRSRAGACVLCLLLWQAAAQPTALAPGNHTEETQEPVHGLPQASAAAAPPQGGTIPDLGEWLMTAVNEVPEVTTWLLKEMLWMFAPWQRPAYAYLLRSVLAVVAHLVGGQKAAGGGGSDVGELTTRLGSCVRVVIVHVVPVTLNLSAVLDGRGSADPLESFWQSVLAVHLAMYLLFLCQAAKACGSDFFRPDPLYMTLRMITNPITAIWCKKAKMMIGTGGFNFPAAPKTRNETHMTDLASLVAGFLACGQWLVLWPGPASHATVTATAYFTLAMLFELISEAYVRISPAGDLHNYNVLEEAGSGQ